MTSSFNVSGLLGGTAGSIDTNALITSLMQGAAVPQSILKDRLSALTNVQNAYQSINTQTAMMQSAAHNVTDAASWNATTALSTSSSVVATSGAGSTQGTTTFSVTQLAQTQVDTVAADSNGNVVSDPTAGITITGSDGIPVAISLTAGDAASVASAINAKAGLGLRASVVTTDTGTRLQLSSAKTGTAAAFTSDGFINPAVNLVPAQDAQVSVGDTTPGGSGYTVSSSTNTFSNLIPGVTFSVSSLASNVSVTVVTDQQSISDKVKALVSAANSLGSLLSSDSAQGGVLQGRPDARTLATALTSSVSHGTQTGASLSDYGIDLDKFGVLTFDATKFATAYAADPAGTQSALAGSFATALNTAADAAIAPITGSVTQALASGTTQATQLNTEISDWTTKLATIQQGFQQKFSTMQTLMSKLQSQQTYLTSMFKSMDSSSSSSN